MSRSHYYAAASGLFYRNDRVDNLVSFSTTVIHFPTKNYNKEVFTFNPSEFKKITDENELIQTLEIAQGQRCLDDGGLGRVEPPKHTPIRAQSNNGHGHGFTVLNIFCLQKWTKWPSQCVWRFTVQQTLNW